MKAVVLTKHGKGLDVLKIQEVDKPSISSGEVLIEVEGFGLNFADVMARNNLYKAAPPIPSVLGYEVVGNVVKGEPDLIGKRVLAFTRFGGYAQYAKADVRALVELSNDTPLGDALALGTQGATAWFAAFYNIKINKGDNVLVHSGAGGVGSILIQMIKNLDVNIYSTAGSSKKCEFIKSQGADFVYDYNNPNYWEQIKRDTKGRGLDVIFDAVGGETYKNGFKSLSAGGKMVTYGAAYRTKSSSSFFTKVKMLFQFGFTNPLFFMLNSRTVCGVNMLKVGDDRPDILNVCLKEVMRMYSEGKIKPIVHDVYEVEKIGQAHDDLENRKTIGKVGVKW